MDAIVCATRWGGELMRMGGELGQVREGFLADLLLVDGNLWRISGSWPTGAGSP